MGSLVRIALACAISFGATAGAAPPAASPAPAVAAPAPQPRPIADFAALPYMSGPLLSPDGTRWAGKIAVNGVQYLAIMAGDRPVLAQLGDVELNAWAWVNNDWLMTQIGGATAVGGQPVYISRLARVSADGRTIRVLDPTGNSGQSSRLLWIARDGSPHILISIQRSLVRGKDFWPSVEDVDVSNGRTRPVLSGVEGVIHWTADSAGAVRIGIGYNDATGVARLLYRPDAGGAFHEIQRANTRNDEELPAIALFPASGAPALTISDSDGFGALYELDPATLKLGRRVFGVAGYDVDGNVFGSGGTMLTGIPYTTDREHVQWMDPNLAAVQAQLDAAVGADRVARIVSLSSDRQRMIVHVGPVNAAGSFYFYDAGQGGAMKYLADVSPRLRDAAMGPVSTIRYKARDGLEMAAVLTLPAHRAPVNLPLILMPHGGPEERVAEGYDWQAQFLADRGYAVIQPNYRGSSGYGTAFRRAGLGEWGLKMQDDLNDAVDRLAQLGIADPKRVCIMGTAYGGYAALRGAQRDGGRYRCAISYAGISDLAGMMRYSDGFLNSRSTRLYWQKRAPALQDVSPIDHAADFSAPVLIMHGKKDVAVPVSQSREMAARLRAAGKDVRYVEQPEGGHYFSREADRLQFLEEVEAFLKAHNPA